MAKKRVAIICGGKSSEHEISCVSAGGVLSAIDTNEFEIVFIGITKGGKWLLLPTDTTFAITNGALPQVPESGVEVVITNTSLQAGGKDLAIDVVFPVLHGPYGEDGTLQGLLEMINLRYVGSGVLASAVSMDKSFAKPIFAAAGLKVAPGIVVTSANFSLPANLTYPLFVKPARSGSSRGTTKVKNEGQLKSAVAFALEFDTKVLIESAVNGREIECAVLKSNGQTIASPVGQIVIIDCYTIINPTVYNRVWDDRWLKRYATALIKRQWGENLKKFGGIQLPGGVVLNGDKIFEEAMQEIDDLEKDMENNYGGVLEFFMN